MNSRSQNLIVGAFTLTSLLILLFGVYFLKETKPGRKMEVYTAVFEQVSTLQEGDPVKVNGVKMGKVKQIDLEDRKVKVNLEVRRGVKLPKDSEIRIQNIGLMGERQIGIRLGTSPEVIPAGGVFEGRLDAGIAEAMGVAGEVFIEAETLVKSLRRVLDSTVARPEFTVRVNSLLSATEEMTQRLNRLAKDVDPQIRSGVSTFQGLSKEVDGFVRNQEPRIQKVLENAGDAAERAKSLAERGEKVAKGLEEILAKANSTDGTVGALLNDATLHRDLRATLESADSLFRVIKKKGLDVNIDLF